LIGLPSQNFAFGNRWKVKTRPFFVIVQLLAIYGWKPVPPGVAMIRFAFV